MSCVERVQRRQHILRTLAPSEGQGLRAGLPGAVGEDPGRIASHATVAANSTVVAILVVDLFEGAPEKALLVSQRLVVNYYTAKRLMGALQLSIQRHEAAFGVLETNVQKRVIPAAMRQSS